jgi:hypothetical protein
MPIFGCGLPAHCCQPPVAGGVIYADLSGELSTHLALQALFTQSSPVREPLLQAFPFPSTLGEVTLHPLSHAGVFIYSSLGSGSSPLSCGVFLPRCFYKLSHSWLLGACPCSCPLQPGPPCLFTVLWGILLPPLWRSGHPTLFAMCLYCSYCLLLSFSFYPGWRSVCPGAMLIWLRVVCGSTTYCLAHLVVCVFPSHLGAGPPGFSV